MRRLSCNQSSRRARGCFEGDPHRRLRFLSDVVADYLARHAANANLERNHYAQFRTLRSAVRAAGLARTAENTRHPHQYRLSPELLATCATRLQTVLPAIERARDFEELFRIVKRVIGPLRGVGELMVYDTASRVGAKLGLEPKRVFLHRGVRVGARHLGLATNREAILRSELPRELRRLPAWQLEDILCIYADEFPRLASAI